MFYNKSKNVKALLSSNYIKVCKGETVKKMEEMGLDEAILVNESILA